MEANPLGILEAELSCVIRCTSQIRQEYYGILRYNHCPFPVDTCTRRLPYVFFNRSDLDPFDPSIRAVRTSNDFIKMEKFTEVNLIGDQ